MKKRYCLAIIISVLFFLFSIFVFAGGNNIWVKCKPNQAAVQGQNCCNNQGSHQWQSMPCCTDEDEDGYLGTPAGCGNDCNDNDPNIKPGASEICDDKDNNCDGAVDESLSQTVGCGTGACYRTKAQTCSAGSWTPLCTPGIAGTETCNNIDDDCDGATDEGLSKQCGSSNVGECRFGTSTCLLGVWNACVGNIEPSAELCDGTDKDCDGLVNCQDPDCQGSISGNVKNVKNQNVADARVEVIPYKEQKYAYTNSLGNYQLNNVLCGTYDGIASAVGYVSSTKSNINLPPRTSITVDFTGLISGTTCEDDCTYAGDNIIHKECDGIDTHGADLDGDGRTDCDFYDNTAKEVCNFAQPGWIRSYDAAREIECAEGAPMEKKEVKAIITCEQGNLIKLTKLVAYKGKLVKLVVVACG